MNRTNKILTYDCIIVGAGIAGQIVAKTLLTSKLKIAVLESGSFKRDPTKDFLNDFTSSGQTFRTDYLSRVRQIGGGTNLWAGRLMRLSKEDLRERDWIQCAGWPITYEELETFYNEVDSEFRIKNSWIESGIENVEEIYKDNLFERVRSVWARSLPRYNSRSKTWKDIVSSSNTTVFTDTTLVKIVDSGTNCVFAHCVRNEKHFTLNTKVLVLAAGGIENVRVMLDSHHIDGTPFVERNLNIGRKFMDHPKWTSQKFDILSKSNLRNFLVKAHRSYSTKEGVKITPKKQEENFLANPYAELSLKMSPLYEETLAKVVSIYKEKKVTGVFRIRKTDLSAALKTLYFLNPSVQMPHYLRRVIQFLSDKLNLKTISDGIIITVHLENTPSSSSAIRSKNRRNKYGCSLIDIEWKVNDIDLTSANYIYENLVHELVKEKIIKKPTILTPITREEITDAAHHMGGTCMSHTESSGVVDRNLKYWGSSGIYLVGSSVFPTSGHANPTYTIAALSLRLGKHLKNIMGERK